MKQKVIRTLAAVVLIGSGIWVGAKFVAPIEAGSSSITPGSVNDPVVTKSYVDEQIAKLLGNVPTQTPQPTPGTGTGSSSSDSLEVVEVLAGKTLMADAGAEVIVRVGKAVAYSSDTNGISDLTAGADLKKGTAVPTDHLIIFPRVGRGVTAESNLTLLVRGGYSIQ